MATNTRLIWVLVIGIAVIGSNSLALSPVLTDVAADLGTSTVTVARANSAYGAATAVSALLLAPHAGRLGLGCAVVIAYGVLAAAMGLSALAPNWIWLALAQALAGMAAGIILPASYALAASAAPDGENARAVGRVLTGWSLSLVAGVPLAALVADLASWRLSYALLGAAVLVALVPLARVAGHARVREEGHSLKTALAQPRVAPLLAVCLLFMTAFYGVYAYLGDHIRSVLELSASEAGLAVLAYGAGFGFASAGDRYIDRLGAGRLFVIVMVSAGGTYLALVPGTALFPGAVVASAAWGFVNHFGLNVLVLLLTRAAPHARTAVLAANSAVSYAGAMIGPMVFGAVYASFGFTPVASLAAALMMLAAALAWRVEQGSKPASPGTVNAAKRR
jgi:predicted MFS family arabinose efflux permease